MRERIDLLDRMVQIMFQSILFIVPERARLSRIVGWIPVQLAPR